MKSNKGFTLIELLAVIVILAVIALIATPMILNVVEDARRGAAKSSVLGYVDAVEKQIMVNLVENKNLINDGDYTIESDGSIKSTAEGATAIPVDVKGDVPSLPENGKMTIADGEVADTTFKMNNGKYTITYSKGVATIAE